MLALIGWILLLAFVFAKVEVQIEGRHGWAEKLPTWRVESHPLLDVFWGGRPITGYHAWLFTFMALVFHLPLFYAERFTLQLEARILGGLALFWIVEDFLWFVINPAFGIRKFGRAHVPWHKVWVGPVPLDYVTFLAVAAALFGYAMWT